MNIKLIAPLCVASLFGFTAASANTSDPAPEDATSQAVLYDQVGYQGPAALVSTAGCHDLGGSHDNELSSIQVSGTVTLYDDHGCNGPGRQITLTRSVPDLGAAGFDNVTSSIRVH